MAAIEIPEPSPARVLYEVNLVVDSDVMEQFRPWLVEHIKQLLHLSGWISASLHEDREDTMEDKTKLTCAYVLESRTVMDHYLKHHAPAFRQDGLDRFAGRFTASRRILTTLECFVANHGARAQDQPEPATTTS